MKKIILYIAIISLGFSSCKKIIDVDTNNAEPQIVIEGNITDQFTDQQILISKSVGYTESGIYPKISGATVNVTDSRGNNYVFSEKSPGVYSNKMRGLNGVTYSLNATVEGKNFTASSKMPNLVKLDSIGIITSSSFGNEKKTTAAYLVDPVAEINFYQFHLYVNDLMSQRIYVSSDRLTNGNKLRIQLSYNGNEDNADEDDDELKSGDKVAVEAFSIDGNIYNYWFAISQQENRGPNQGTTPSNPPSNISNGALGYFSANTYQKLSLTVK